MYLEQLYTEIYFIFPDGIKARQRLCDFYLEIINKVPEPFTVKLFVRSAARFKKQHEPRLTRAVQAFELPFQDIWLGDYFPFRSLEGSFTFKYLDQAEDQELLLEFLGDKCDFVPLNLDLGCFELIDDVLLLSSDVYTRNSKYSRSKIDRILKDYFEHERMVVLDAGTRLNHIDTMFRVFDNLVLYNSCHTPPDTLALVRAALSRSRFVLHDLPFELSGGINDREEDFVESYVGNAFDFIVLGSTMLFPIVTRQDRKSLQALKKIMRSEKIDKEVIVLEHPDLEALYKLGGGLFCIAGIC